MRRIHAVLALTIATLGVPSAFAQMGSTDPTEFLSRYSVALGYSNIRANAPPGDCGCFDMNGGFLSANYKLKYWLSAAVEVNGGHAKDISPLGQDLTLLTYTAGPRVTFREARVTPFVQALFGAAHGADSYFPTGTTYTTSATSFAFTAGGGVDYHLSHRLAVRPIEAQYLHTSFPNGTNNSQNHLVLGAGVVFKFGGQYAQPQAHYSKKEKAAIAASESGAAPAPPQPSIATPQPEASLTPAPVSSPIIDSKPAVVSSQEFHDHVKDAYFDYDSSALRPDAQQAIAEAAAYLAKHPQMQVLVGGFSDERGTSEYNLELGERRAEAARQALIAAGVAMDRLRVVSYGKGTQVCTVADEACWQQNRRAAFQMQP